MSGQRHAEEDHFHPHAAPREASEGGERKTLIAFVITFLFMLVEAGGGYLSGSLALLADSAHMLVDAVALLTAWLAFRLGRMAPDDRRSYGYRRVEVLAALINGALVLVLSAGILIEAVMRFSKPEPVAGWTMLIVGVVGGLANLVVFRILKRDDGHDHHHGHAHGHGREHGHESGARDLNLHAASLHVLSDLLGSVAAVAAALVILITGWMPIDSILSALVALLIVVSGVRLLRQTFHILLEGSPEGFDAEALRLALVEQVPGLVEVHHIHAWLVTPGQPMITLHAVAAWGVDRDRLLRGIKKVLTERFGFSHSVVQVEGPGNDPDDPPGG